MVGGADQPREAAFFEAAFLALFFFEAFFTAFLEAFLDFFLVAMVSFLPLQVYLLIV